MFAVKRIKRRILKVKDGQEVRFWKDSVYRVVKGEVDGSLSEDTIRREREQIIVSLIYLRISN